MKEDIKWLRRKLEPLQLDRRMWKKFKLNSAEERYIFRLAIGEVLDLLDELEEKELKEVEK